MPSLADAERAGDESLGRLAEGGPGSTTFSAIFNSFGDTTEEKNENPEEISSSKRGPRPAPKGGLRSSAATREGWGKFLFLFARLRWPERDADSTEMVGASARGRA